MRLFVALELPEGERRRLAELHERERFRWRGLESASLNWTREENLHITLKFLGEVSDQEVRPVTDALGRVRFPHPIALRIESLGFLPLRGPIRVFTARIGGDFDGLAALHAAIELAMEPLGFPREQRPYSPHVTLARPRREGRISGDARAAVAEHQPPPGPEFVVDRLVMMSSELSNGPPRYRPIAHFAFTPSHDVG
jgi:2'-5' RNA ligase